MLLDYLTILEPLDLFNSGPDRLGWLIDYGVIKIWNWYEDRNVLERYHIKKIELNEDIKHFVIWDKCHYCNGKFDWYKICLECFKVRVNHLFYMNEERILLIGELTIKDINKYILGYFW